MDLKKDLISIADLTQTEIIELFNLTSSIKTKTKKGVKFQPLSDKTLAMIFQKPSTRTRVSFEVAMASLGGHAIFLRGQDLQLKRGETINDTARTLSRYVDGIMIRTVNHKDIIELAKYSTIPVINGLSDIEHPCQVLSDIFTIIEKKNLLTYQRRRSINLSTTKIVFIGDGNNVANSWLLASGLLGLNFVACTPDGFEPDKKIYQQSLSLARKSHACITLSHNPKESVQNADFIYTDVWTSMGKEEEKEIRREIFKPYQVNSALLKETKTTTFIMHCLPAQRGEEITAEVIDGKNSIVFDQVENRLHLQKAILTFLLGSRA